jgi:hypothetical protein
MCTEYAWKTAVDTPLMRKQVHRICVEKLAGVTLECGYGQRLRQLIRLGFGGVVGSKAAAVNLKSPRRRVPARACPANTRWADE